MSDERIIQKIQKLFALGESANEHEAANAMAKAQILMEKYGLNQKAIELSKIGSVDRDGLVRAIDLPDWYKGFTGCIARCFGVRTVMCRVPGRVSREWCTSKVVFVGHNDRIELAAYCYEVVGRQLLQARKAYNKQLGAMDANRKWKIVESYCEGYVASLEEKITAFVLDPRENELVEDKLGSLFSSLKIANPVKEKKLSREEMAARFDGQDDGEKVSLHRPMNGQETTKIGVER